LRLVAHRRFAVGERTEDQAPGRRRAIGRKLPDRALAFLRPIRLQLARERLQRILAAARGCASGERRRGASREHRRRATPRPGSGKTTQEKEPSHHVVAAGRDAARPWNDWRRNFWWPKISE
jgi:hypothetical protein